MAADIKTNEFFYNETKQSSKCGKFVNLLQFLAIGLVVVVLLYLVILLPNQVDGVSMEPNFRDKEQLFTDKTINLFRNTPIGASLNYDYDRGDVVVFPFEDILLIKRIIAKSGDFVKVENGRVYVNDTLLDEDYIDPLDKPTFMPFGSQATFREGETVVVPDDHFFILGDNRPNSKDSRFSDVGFVPAENLSGRVFLRYWPLNAFGIIGRGTTNLD
ncbi:MAG: signal peptidase I [Candidatus Dojkabacteria bacterium]|uniref:Signal peptidase I n=2 Tax=Candidatus Dojkabacteria TaxID=74243 RepID=A0A136KG27_9BACT|nr:MAG: Signal peptidase I S [candidate division WS6 bacterium OLB21]MBW7953421.1 signal peptidase I [Candidatus Dojkabacteria bacterium]WKZ27626.1 MAG: signal peptidase I [Candidatus Dojkabacteria bacterium]